MGLFSFLTQELAIDLGTANTLIYHNDKVVVDEPSIVAKDRTTGKTVAIGRKAQQMHGKTHENIKTIRPLKDGVIADFQSAEHMIKGLIKMINDGKRMFAPSLRMVICIPSGITEVEKRAVKASTLRISSSTSATHTTATPPISASRTFPSPKRARACATYSPRWRGATT